MKDDCAHTHSAKINGYIELSEPGHSEGIRHAGDVKLKTASKSIICNGVSCNSKPGKLFKNEHLNTASNSSEMLSSIPTTCTNMVANQLREGLENLTLNGVDHEQENETLTSLEKTTCRTEDNYVNSSEQTSTATQLDSSRSLYSQECLSVSQDGNKTYGKGNLVEDMITNTTVQCVLEPIDPKLVKCCDSSNHLSNLKTIMVDIPSGTFLDEKSSGHTQVSQKDGKNVISSGKSNALDKVAKDLDSGRNLLKYEMVVESKVSEEKDRKDNLSKTITGAEISQSDVNYVVYESELNMPDIIRLIQKDLSEPYSIYTYRYFIHNWPYLCFMAKVGTECVGAIVCKLDYHKKVVKRGYIAMLAVDSKYRKLKIGSTLVRKAIEAMIAEEADEVVLETEITNRPALRLYENLGFVRDKRLFRYYLNGVDALRLKLWLR